LLAAVVETKVLVVVVVLVVLYLAQIRRLV
jgi:hypothetical protein